MGAEITAKHMSCVIATNVNDERNFLLRLVPLPLKNLVMKAVFDTVGERKTCLSFSNLGQIRLPEPMIPYIDRIDFILGVQSTAPYNCGMCSFGDTVYVNKAESPEAINNARKLAALVPLPVWAGSLHRREYICLRKKK